ncbi:MAG: DUF6653 family protein [Pseudomonadota bacterium]
MDIYAFSERMMSMDDDAWARHAHPFSVWTRVLLGLPVIVLAIWSRAWIGWWALPAFAGAAFFVWINPRLTPKPKRTDRWSSKVTFGERVFLNRKRIAIPDGHRRAANILTGVSLFGAPFLIYGLLFLNVWPTLFGSALIYLGKLWFCDRMVWLYDDMREKNEEYASWLKTG